jgi:hypothetical protein
MKTIFFTLFALGGMIVSTLSNPIKIEANLESRQLETEADQLDILLAGIDTHTARMGMHTGPSPPPSWGTRPFLWLFPWPLLTVYTENAVANVPATASEAEKQKVADSMANDFSAITTLLNQATAVLSKRELYTRGGKCDSSCLRGKVQVIVTKLSVTIKIILAKLGLCKSSLA